MDADPERGVALDICRVPAGLRFTVHGLSVASAWVDPKYAPAIALSVLESAGWPEEAAHSVTHQILDNLRRVVEIADQMDKEAGLTRRRDALAAEFHWGPYSKLGWGSQRSIDKIIELQDACA